MHFLNNSRWIDRKIKDSRVVGRLSDFPTLSPDHFSLRFQTITDRCERNSRFSDGGGIRVYQGRQQHKCSPDPSVESCAKRRLRSKRGSSKREYCFPPGQNQNVSWTRAEPVCLESRLTGWTWQTSELFASLYERAGFPLSSSSHHLRKKKQAQFISCISSLCQHSLSPFHRCENYARHTKLWTH